MYIRESDISWAINVLKDMISIPTVNPPGVNYDKFAEYVSKLMRVLGLDVEIIEVPRDLIANICAECKNYPRYIIVGCIGEGKPVIHFNGHYDVVPPGEGWKYNPFEAYVEENKIYGRGSVDMKGGIASVLLAIKTFISMFKDFNGSIEVALVPDEEIGGETGTGYLTRIMRKQPDYVIIAEGSGSTNLWIGHKGALWGFVEVTGVQAHGSTPWRGVNAFEYMAKIALRFLEKHFELIQGKISNYDYLDPEGAKPTLTLGGEVKGSTKVNMVPGFYAFSFDRRIIPEESVEAVENEIKKIIEDIAKEFPQVKIGIEVVNKLKPALTKENTELVKTLEQSIELVLGIKPRKVLCLGGLDMHYYTEKGIETVTYGPGPDVNAHVVNEYVLVDEVINVARVYVNTLTKLLR
ncbi:MAG: M20 family metallopeptidase [Ignisphaera sp.]